MKETLLKNLKVTKETLYANLALIFKFTPNQIADMNVFQQLAISDLDDSAADTIQFERIEDFLRWRQQEGFDG